MWLECDGLDQHTIGLWMVCFGFKKITFKLTSLVRIDTEQNAKSTQQVVQESFTIDSAVMEEIAHNGFSYQGM